VDGSIFDASSRVILGDPAWLAEKTGETSHDNLDRMLAEVFDLLSATSEILSKTYFARVRRPQQLGVGTIEPQS
jgi:hypothetical protein